MLTPRSTLAAWLGANGAELRSLFDAHREFVRGAQVLHADEAPVNMLDPDAGKTRRAYISAHARDSFDALAGVAYDFCVGRGAQYPIALQGQWSGTLVRDKYRAYDSVVNLQDRWVRVALHMRGRSRARQRQSRIASLGWRSTPNRPQCFSGSSGSGDPFHGSSKASNTKHRMPAASVQSIRSRR